MSTSDEVAPSTDPEKKTAEQKPAKPPSENKSNTVSNEDPLESLPPLPVRSSNTQLPLLSTAEEIEQWAHVRRTWSLQMGPLQRLVEEYPELAAEVARCRALDYISLLTKYDGGLANVRNFSVLSGEIEAVKALLPTHLRSEFASVVNAVLAKLSVIRLHDTALKRSLKVGIIGGGAIGCYLAIRLAQAGARVTIVDRGSLREKLTRQKEDVEALYLLSRMSMCYQKELNSASISTDTEKQEKEVQSETKDGKGKKSDTNYRAQMHHAISRAAHETLSPELLSLPLSLEAYDPLVDVNSNPHVAPVLLRCDACVRKAFVKRVCKMQHKYPEIRSCATAIRRAALICQDMLIDEYGTLSVTSISKTEHNSSNDDSDSDKITRHSQSSGFGNRDQSMHLEEDSVQEEDDDEDESFEENDIDDQGLRINQSLTPKLVRQPSTTRPQAWASAMDRLHRLTSKSSRLSMLTDPVSGPSPKNLSSTPLGISSSTSSPMASTSAGNLAPASLCTCQFPHQIVSAAKPYRPSNVADESQTSGDDFDAPSVERESQIKNKDIFNSVYPSIGSNVKPRKTLQDRRRGDLEDDYDSEQDSEDAGFEGIINVSSRIEDIVSADVLLTCVKAHDASVAFDSLATALTLTDVIAARAELAEAEKDLAHLINFVRRRAPKQFENNPLPDMGKVVGKASGLSDSSNEGSPSSPLQNSQTDLVSLFTTMKTKSKTKFTPKILRPLESLDPPRCTRYFKQRLVVSCQNGIVNLDSQLRGLEGIPACSDVGAAVVEFNVLPSGGSDLGRGNVNASPKITTNSILGIGSSSAHLTSDQVPTEDDYHTRKSVTSSQPSSPKSPLSINRLASLATWTEEETAAATRWYELSSSSEGGSESSLSPKSLSDLSSPSTSSSSLYSETDRANERAAEFVEHLLPSFRLTSPGRRQLAIQRMLDFIGVPASLAAAESEIKCGDPISHPQSLVVIGAQESVHAKKEHQDLKGGKKKKKEKEHIIPRFNSATSLTRLRFTKTTKGLISLTIPFVASERLVPSLSLTAPGSPLWNLLQAFADVRVTALCLGYDEWLAVARAKLVVNLLNSVNAASGVPLANTLADANYRLAAAALMREAIDVFDASGKKLGSFNGISIKLLPALLLLPTPVVRFAARFALGMSSSAKLSMLMDLERGAKTEVEILNGEVVSVALSVGAGCDLNRAMSGIIHSLEGILCEAKNSEVDVKMASASSFESKGAESNQLEDEESGAENPIDSTLRSRKKGMHSPSKVKVSSNRVKTNQPVERVDVTIIDSSNAGEDDRTSIYLSSDELIRELGGKDKLESLVITERMIAAAILAVMICIVICILFILGLGLQFGNKIAKMFR